MNGKKNRKISFVKGFKSNFTLIEVTLAIAVISVGMMGIIALFPVGLKSARDAVGDNYSSEMADQFLQLVKMQCLKYTCNNGGEYCNQFKDPDGDGIENYDGWGEYMDDRDGNGQFWDGSGWVTRKLKNDKKIPPIPTTSPNSTYLDIGEVESAQQAKANGSLTPSLFFGDADGDGWDDLGIYYDKGDISKGSTENDGVFYVEARSGDVVDWNGVMYLWREKLRYQKSDGTYGDMDYKFAARLCLEISWPFDKPYAQREKRVYALEIFAEPARAGY